MTPEDGKLSYVHGSEELTYYPKQSTVNVMTIKIPMSFFAEIEKSILKCIHKH
jgi:hypothetical protein